MTKSQFVTREVLQLSTKESSTINKEAEKNQETDIHANKLPIFF